jgi:RNA-directed DNA polymerase
MYEHILKTQRSFARKAQARKEHRFGDLYHLICREDWIRAALEHVLSNVGSRTAGVDGVSKADLKTEAQQLEFVQKLMADLKSGAYQPMPVKRVWIDKTGKPEKRGLGVPTIRDRVVQELLRMLMEPIWESDFLDCSHGFRPGRRTMDCVRVFYNQVQTRNKHFWAIEGDIRKCFDCIHHRILLELVRRRIADHRIVNLVKAFLKAGLMDEGLFRETPEGTPQGGILSPLLANIYLHQLDLWWWRKFRSLSVIEKQKRRRHKLGGAILVRYADDFVILWNGTHQRALALRDEIKQFLWEELRLELSDEKTRVTHLTDGIDFLGFHIRWRIPGNGHKPGLRVTPTKANLKRLRAQIKAMTRRDMSRIEPEIVFKSLNRVIRGWGYYYRYVNFGQDASKLDYWVNRRVLIWLKHRHQGRGVRSILRQYKRREVTQQHNRWNFATEDSNSGKPVFIAQLSDIPIRRDYRRKPGNPYLTADGLLNCPETEAPFVKSWAARVPPKTVTWRSTRAQVLKRDEYRCTQCGKAEVPLEAHHKVPLRDDGEDALDNLTSLCKDCHSETPSYGKHRKGRKFNGEPDDAKVSRPVRKGG